MGRQASITRQQVKAAVAELQAGGKSVSLRTVREKFGNVGSMGTVNKLLRQWLGEKDEILDSLRPLRPELQQAILTFADQQASDARLVRLRLRVDALAPLEGELRTHTLSARCDDCMSMIVSSIKIPKNAWLFL